MPIETGQRAPDFTLYSDQTNAWTLSEDGGDQHTLLLFFPGAFTGVCTAEMCSVNADLSEYNDLDANVVGISTDSPFVLKHFKEENGLDFTLLSDHDGEVSARYDSKYDHDFTPMELDRIAKRSAFVIDRDGVVRYAEVLDNAGEQPDFEAIQRTLRDLG